MTRDHLDRSYDRAYESLDEDLASGAISQHDYNEQTREMTRDYRDEIEAGANEAADRFRQGW